MAEASFVVLPTFGLLMPWRSTAQLVVLGAAATAALVQRALRNRRIPKFVVVDARSCELRFPSKAIPFSDVIRIERERVRQVDDVVETRVSLVMRGNPPVGLASFASSAEAEALAAQIEELVYGSR